jgi:hypothetical protein
MAVSQDAKDRKDVRHPLDLVKNDQTLQGAENEHRVRKFLEVIRILQVKPRYTAPQGSGHLSGQGGLPHLPRAQDGHHRIPGQEPPDCADMSDASYHADIIP